MKKEFLNIIESAKKGDKNAFNELFKASYETVYYTCLKTVNSEQDALDLTQEIFLKIFKNLASLKNNETYFAWLKTITANTCINHFSRNNKDILLEDEEYSEIIFKDTEKDITTIPQEALEQKATEEIMMSIFSKLPESQRLCIIMYYYDEMTIKEIATALNVSENTIKSRLGYAKRTIESEVKKQEKDNGLKLYGAAPIMLLKAFFDKESKTIPAMDNSESLCKISKEAVRKVNNKLIDNIKTKIIQMSLKQKVLSFICTIALIAVPTTLLINHSNPKTESSVLYRYYKKPSDIVERFLNAAIEKDYSTMYDCCVFNETDFINKEKYIEYKKTSSEINLKQFAVKDAEEINEYGKDEFKVSFDYKLDNEGGYNTYYLIVINTSLSEKPIYKVVPQEQVQKNYTIKAPIGANVTVDGIILDDSYIKETEESYEWLSTIKYSYHTYIIPELFAGKHTAKVESDFMLPIEKELNFNSNISDFLSFDITNEFKESIGENLKFTTRNLMEKGFSKSATYDEITSLFSCDIDPNITSLRETYNAIYNAEDVNSATGYKNYKLSEDSTVEYRVSNGTIIVKINCEYDCDYFFYTNTISSMHWSDNKNSFTYSLTKEPNGWKIISSASFF